MLPAIILNIFALLLCLLSVIIIPISVFIFWDQTEKYYFLEFKQLQINQFNVLTILWPFAAICTGLYEFIIHLVSLSGVNFILTVYCVLILLSSKRFNGILQPLYFHCTGTNTMKMNVRKM